MNLYQLTTDQLSLTDKLIELEGELTPELEEALKLNKENLQAKGVSYGYVIKNISAEVDIIDAEIKRLTALKKARANAVERLKTSLSTAMTVFNVTEIKASTFKISFRKSQAVAVPDVNLIPDEFKRVTVEANKSAIKEAIESGIEVQGAGIVTNYSLQIR